MVEVGKHINALGILCLIVSIYTYLNNKYSTVCLYYQSINKMYLSETIT